MSNHNSRTRAWARLTQLTGEGSQGIIYNDSSTLEINERIQEISDCPICYESLRIKPIELGCGHIFHNRCIKKMIFLHMDSKCPLCRESFIYTELTGCSELSAKQRKHLKWMIISHFEQQNRCSRIRMMEIVSLGIFLKLEQNIGLHFLDYLVKYITDDPFRMLYLMNSYISIYPGGNVIYPEEFCNEDCETHHTVNLDNNETYNRCKEDIRATSKLMLINRNRYPQVDPCQIYYICIDNKFSECGDQ